MLPFNNFAIFEALSSSEHLFYNAGGTIEEPVRNLLQAFATAGCQSVVLEKSYVDLDFKAGYSRFYYLHHRDTLRRCARAHFFARRVTEDDLYRMDTEVKNDYLGYTTIRPLPTHVAGRTVIAGRVLERMYPGLYPGENRYVTCLAKHTTNLAGNRVTFLGTPWMQQDKLTAACASVAIWIVNWHMSHLYPSDFLRYTTPNITDLAVRFSMARGRAMPTDGLHVEQMMSALVAMGYEPFLRIPKNAREGRRIIYYYIESGIPILAIVGFLTPQSGLECHAVTIIGYTLDTSKPLDTPEITRQAGHQLLISNSSDYIPRFIAQDDSGGPFRFVELFDWDSSPFPKITRSKKNMLRAEFPCQTMFDRETPRSENAFLSALIIPVPKRVTLDGSDAEKNAKKIVEQEIWPTLEAKHLIFRTFLQPSNNVKMWWEPKASGSGRPAEVGLALRHHSLPHWVWMTEFADVRSWSAGNVLGQVIQDSSGRGTHAPWDDIVAYVGPQQMVLYPPDTQADPVDTHESLSEPIARYCKDEVQFS